MLNKLKPLMAVLLIVLTIVCSVITIVGGPVKPLKKQLKYGLDINGGVYVVMEGETKAKGEQLDTLMKETKGVIENRVNTMGISEANVTIEGKKRIRVELPGVKDADSAIKQIGKTAQLNFLLADGSIALTGSDVKDASATLDNEHGGYKINLKFSNEGAKKFEAATKRASSGAVTSASKNIDSRSIIITLDGRIISAPRVENTITGTSCEITSPSGFQKKEATELAQLIKGGALPLSMHEVSSSVQSASIGADALNKAIFAGAIGIAIVFILMIGVFEVFGLMADLALALYVLLNLWAYKGMGVVLSLPSIAGIILSIGMAVDANVVIFTRIKEEVKKGKGLRHSVYEGFKKASSSIIDSQVTTLIAAFVLYLLGTTSVKGFALTLMIGVVLSMFTAIVVTRLYITVLVERFRNLKISKVDFVPKFDFIKHKKKFFTLSLAVIMMGSMFSLARGMNYGIDFTGGTMITADMGSKTKISDVKKAVKDYRDVSIVYGNKEQSKVIIKTTSGISGSEKAKVVSNLKAVSKNTKIETFEEFGPSVSKELKSNAIKAISIAALCMLLYIRLRFKDWKYGLSAVAGLGHDILVTLSLYAIFGLTINNPFIAGILTVVGYSINDTIIIFDRIREEKKFMNKKEFDKVINNSINQMFSRSVMTSLTTLGAILPLFIMVSSELRAFTIPLLIGVTVGTYSSIFLCSPLLYILYRRANRTRYERATQSK